MDQKQENSSLFELISTRLSLANFLIIALFIAVLAVGVRPISDPDFGFHLKTGEYLVEHLRIPAHDVFSYTTGKNPLILYSWLFQVVLYLIRLFCGWSGLAIFRGLLTLLAFIMIYITLKKREDHFFLPCLLTAFALWTSWEFYTERPQLVSFLFFSIFVFVILEFRDRKRDLLWLLPLITLVWANVHAFYAIGILLISSYVAVELVKWSFKKSAHDLAEIKKMIVVSLLSALCALINPYGYKIFLVPLQLAQEKVTQLSIVEMQSPNFHNPYFIPLEILIIMLLLLFLFSKKKIDVWSLGITLLLFHESLSRVRSIPYLVIFVTPLIAARMSDVWNTLRKKRSWRSAMARPRAFASSLVKKLEAWPLSAKLSLKMALFLVLFLIFVYRGGMVFGYPWDQDFFPRRATDFIVKYRPQGRLFNDFGWGGYLIYRLYPDYQVYIDGRTTVHGQQFMLNFYDIMEGHPKWVKEFKKYRINVALLGRGTKLGIILLYQPDWRVVYMDEQAAVFVRVIPENYDLLKKVGYSGKEIEALKQKHVIKK